MKEGEDLAGGELRRGDDGGDVGAVIWRREFEFWLVGGVGTLVVEDAADAVEGGERLVAGEA